jgi:hypothetical protein
MPALQLTTGVHTLLVLPATIAAGNAHQSCFPMFLPVQRSVHADSATSYDIFVLQNHYRRISKELLPTPAKSHYTFNLRDLSKQFQGMLMVSPSSCSDKEALARLWMHEVCRVFADRLVCDEDRQYFQRMLVSTEDVALVMSLNAVMT